MAQEVEVKLKVETSKAVSDVNKLGDAFDNTAQDAQDAQDIFSQTGKSLNMEPSINNLKALKRELKATTAGTKDFDKLSMSIRDMEDAINDAKKGNDDFLGQMENAPGILGMVGRSIRGAEAATNSFSGALKATGIGLIVALLGGLAAAFSNNEGAMKKLQPLLDGIGKIFQGVFRAVEPLFNTLVDMAVNALPMVSKAFAVVYSSVTSVFQSLGKLGSAIGKLISGDFSGAWKDAKSSVNDFGKNYDESIKRFTQGSKELTKTEKEEADKRAEARKASQEKQAAIDEKAKQERIRIAKEEAEALKAFQDDVLKNQQQMNVDKVNAEIQESLDEKERKRQSLEDISAMVDALDAEDLIKAKANSDAKILLAQKEAEAKQVLFAKTSETLTKGADLLGKNTAAGKSMAVAAALINTYQGITAELATKTVTPFEIGLKIANVGIIAATGFKAVKNILAVKTPGGGGSGGGGSMGSISTPATVAPNVNVVGASRTNAIAETIAQQGQQPIRTYVVANDVTTQQGLNRSIVTSASIG
jgi:hypothetical protein